jgi:membrane-bound acyltransferase YfiQ involved in biofilm formation
VEWLICVVLSIILLKKIWVILFKDTLTSIILGFGNDIISTLFALSIVFFLSALKKYSSILLFFGKYSYELFLIHGVFLIKYNPFFEKMPFPEAYILYFVLITFLAFLFNLSLKSMKFSLNKNAIVN